MDSADKKDVDGKGPATPPPPAAAADAAGVDVEERERQARELKAGLHPLKVSVWRILFWSSNFL